MGYLKDKTTAFAGLSGVGKSSLLSIITNGELETGSILEGKVTGITKFGAFVELPGGRTGMVHISELSWSRIKTPAEVCKVGDTMDVYIISFDPEKKKISLGMKDHSQDPGPCSLLSTRWAT